MAHAGKIMATSLSFGARLSILLLQGYQHWLSPLLGPRCRFQPSCSAYAIEALQRFGLIKGGWLAIKRLVKCHPLHAGGDDPVPRTTHDHDKNHQ